MADEPLVEYGCKTFQAKSRMYVITAVLRHVKEMDDVTHCQYHFWN